MSTPTNIMTTPSINISQIRVAIAAIERREGRSFFESRDEDEDEDEDEDDEPSCEHCGCKDGDIMVHSFGCVALCDKCSDIDEQPHCPRTHRDHEHDPCEYCVDGWAWIDERVPVTYKGAIIGYSKVGEVRICKFSQRHQ